MELVLTLDRTVQALVEAELERSVQEYQAEGGTIIVMDPRTFEILALASLPNYDPGRYNDFYGLEPLPFEDPAVSKQYEPGSVFKVLTVAAALDAGLVTPETTYYDQGWIEVGGLVVANASRQAYGERTVADIMIHSLNVGTAWLSAKMGPDIFYRYLQKFGIGQVTGVGLAGEVAGQLLLPQDYERWHDSNLGVNSFGQGLAVTPLQMISAVATVANDGARLRPHVVARRVAPDGAVSTFRSEIEARVISPQTARMLMEMMVRTVDEGVPSARVPGYRVAGKTGTAQIPIPGGYDREATIVSFVGFGPVPDPRLVILVKLDRPKSSSWASDTAAPVFQRLAARLFVTLGIPPGGMEVAVAR
jgi:cell division protein FtsI/penicillin-binding protein 2